MIHSTLERRQQDSVSTTATAIAPAPGWSGRLVPYLVIAMETCWVDALLIALASVNFFQRQTTLFPLWAPFVLIAGSYWLLTYLERREAIYKQTLAGTQKTRSDSSLFILLIALLTLFVIWDRIYGASFLFFDPRWLLALLNDIFAVGATAYYILILVALSLYCCWRGVRLTRHVIEPAAVFRALCLGMGIILVAIVVHAGSQTGSFDELVLLCLIPFFLFCALAAHALAKVVFVRRYHRVGLQGSEVMQERATLMIVGIIGLAILLLTVLIGSFTNPHSLADFQRALAPVGKAYDWLVGIIVYGLVFLLYPLFLFFSWLFSLPHGATQPKPQHIVGKAASLGAAKSGPDSMIMLIATILKIALPCLFIALLVGLLIYAVRRRRAKLIDHTRSEDIHESLWSWELFRAQFKAFLLAIWQRFFARRPAEQKVRQEVGDSAMSVPGSIREMYRALLHWAAGRGYGRKREETPYEFQKRLSEHLPGARAELSNLTEAYAAVRYGGVALTEDEVIQVQADYVGIREMM